MRTIIQRVLNASVLIDNKVVSKINKGLLLLIGFEESEKETDIEWLINKITNLRIFSDENNKMNLSINEINGEILVVSQFTLYASTKKGNRPSFTNAANPDIAIKYYEQFVINLERKIGKKPQLGVFGADMKISLTNDGPVTIFIDTNNKE